MDPLHATAAASGAADAPPPWWRGAVVYENHLPSFRDGNGDGIGDLEGLIAIARLPRRHARRDAVWVGPFFRSPLLDQGFDITDSLRRRAGVRRPRDVRPADRGGARARHPGDRRLHPEPHVRPAPVVPSRRARRATTPSATGTSGPTRGPARRSANNWTSETGGSVWESDERDRPVLPALPPAASSRTSTGATRTSARRCSTCCASGWTAASTAFRIDVAHMLMKDPELRDNPPSAAGATTRSTCSTPTSSASCTSTTAAPGPARRAARHPRGARRVRRRPRRDRRDRGDGVGRLGAATTATELDGCTCRSRSG